MKTSLKQLFTLVAVFLVASALLSENTYAQWDPTRYISRLIVRDSSTHRGPLKLNVGANFIVNGATVASIDSFPTTAAVDTLTVAGVAVGDLVFVQPYLPAHSTTPDTGSTQYDAIAITGKIVVRRAKLTPASTLKSAGIYQYFIVRKN